MRISNNNWGKVNGKRGIGFWEWDWEWDCDWEWQHLWTLPHTYFWLFIYSLAKKKRNNWKCLYAAPDKQNWAWL